MSPSLPCWTRSALCGRTRPLSLRRSMSSSSRRAGSQIRSRAQTSTKCNVSPAVFPLVWLEQDVCNATSIGIGEREWLYRTKFDVPELERSWKNAELVFEGLDTLCDVYLVSFFSCVSRMLTVGGRANDMVRDLGLWIEWQEDPVRGQYVPRMVGFAVARRPQRPRQPPSPPLHICEEAREGTGGTVRPRARWLDQPGRSQSGVRPEGAIWLAVGAMYLSILPPRRC